jgi:hypothetical protein
MGSTLGSHESAKMGREAALIAASRYQKHAIQTPPANFQTVSKTKFR